MKGHFYTRGCTCKKIKCTCGSKWAFTIDIGVDPGTGKRKQKARSGFKSKTDALQAAITLMHELKQHAIPVLNGHQNGATPDGTATGVVCMWQHRNVNKFK